MAIAALDSNAFFHDLATGADADMSGVVSLVLAANALSSLYRDGAPNLLERQILFAFFVGESFGYIGSERFVYDITQFECKKQEGNHCVDPRKILSIFLLIVSPNSKSFSRISRYQIEQNGGCDRR